MIISSSIELRELTGSYYSNSDFSKIKNDVMLETEAIIKLVGQSVYDRAKAVYQPSVDGYEPGRVISGSSEENKQLLEHLQIPIAMGAAFNYMQSNLVSHGDAGRKVKLDKNNESLAWQWMIDADDEAHIRKTQRVTDRLIAWLDQSSISEWQDGKEKKAAKELFVPNTDVFQKFFPIDGSGLFYHTVRPFISTIQKRQIKNALDDEYPVLLTEFESGNISEGKETLVEMVQEALVLLTMGMAFKRLSIQLLPAGVVQKFTSERNTTKGSQIPLTEDLRRYSLYLERDAQDALDQIRRYRYENSPEYIDPILLPKNDPSRKFART